MKVLIYKRTHKGDPDLDGVFGTQDCMGRIRNWNYDAVIGIGGIAPWKKDVDIKCKINWIGLGPKKIASTERGNMIAFAHFELYEGQGKNIKDNYPHLFEYMYGKRKRFSMSSDLPKNVFKEVEEILDSIKNSPPSRIYEVENRNKLVVKNLDLSKCTGCSGSKRIKDVVQE